MEEATGLVASQDVPKFEVLSHWKWSRSQIFVGFVRLCLTGRRQLPWNRWNRSSWEPGSSLKVHVSLQFWNYSLTCRPLEQMNTCAIVSLHNILFYQSASEMRIRSTVIRNQESEVNIFWRLCSALLTFTCWGLKRLEIKNLTLNDRKLMHVNHKNKIKIRKKPKTFTLGRLKFCNRGERSIIEKSSELLGQLKKIRQVKVSYWMKRSFTPANKHDACWVRSW